MPCLQACLPRATFKRFVNKLFLRHRNDYTGFLLHCMYIDSRRHNPILASKDNNPVAHHRAFINLIQQVSMKKVV